MALRIREDGRILCAAIHPAQPGDVYIDDAIHYWLSVRAKLIGTEAEPTHSLHGEWWARGSAPEGVEIEPFYGFPEPEPEAKQGSLI